jgi:hypothetical protein
MGHLKLLLQHKYVAHQPTNAVPALRLSLYRGTQGKELYGLATRQSPFIERITAR